MAQIKLAEYTFDNSVGDCLPALNPNTITMTKEDSVSGTTTRRIVYIDNSIMPSTISFYGSNSLLTLDYLNMGTNITSMYQMFYSCTSVTMIDCTGWDTSNVTDMYQLFNYCPKLREIKSLETINTSKITNMAHFFRYCDLVDVSGIANWNVSKVTTFEKMFEKNTSLKTVDASGWTTTSCKTMNNMFSDCSSLTSLDLSSWDTSSCTNMSGMFSVCTQLIEIKGIDNLDVSSVTNFASMFYQCSSLTELDLRNWVTSSAMSFNGMFKGCSSLETLRVDNFDYKEKDAGGTVLNDMFQNCTKLKQIFLPKLTNKGLGNFNGFCSGCSNLEYISMPNFVWGNCNSMDGTFQNCTSLKMLDLTTLDSSTFANKVYGIGGIIKNITCPVYYNSNTCSSSDFTDIPNKTNLIDVQGRLMAVYDFNNTVTSSADAYPTLSGSNIAKTVDTQGSESYITHRVIGVDVMPTEISFKPIRGLLNVDYLGVTSSCTSLASLFENCFRMTYVDTFGWDTSNVTSFAYCFRTCSSLTEIRNIQGLKVTSKVTLAYDFFHGCSKLTSLDLTHWDVSGIKNGSVMFRDCSGLTSLNISNWDVSSIQYGNSMFYGCTSLSEVDLTSFKTTTMESDNYNMFYGWTSDQIVYVHGTNWTLDTSSYNATFVRRLSTLLAKYTFDNSVGDCLPTITGIATSDYIVSDIVNNTVTTRLITSENVLPTRYQFKGIKSLTRLEYLEMSEVTNMQDILSGCSNLEYLDVSQWNTSKVTNMYYAFIGCAKLTEIIGIEDLDVSNCTNLSCLFESCSGLTSLDLSKWNVTKCTQLNQLFYRCTSLVSVNLSGWNTTNNTRLDNIFSSCTRLTEIIGLETWDTSNVTNMANIFNNCYNITSIEMVRNWNTSKVIDMSGTFGTMTSITSLEPILNWDTSKVTTMKNIFAWLKVESFSFANWDTSNVGNMNYMLAGLPLDGWDLTNLNTSSANNMSNMFEGCTVTGNLDLSFFDVNKVTNMTNMFAKANVSDTIILDNWDLNHNTTNITYMFSACKAPHISFKWKNTDKITSLKDTFNSCSNLVSLDFSSWDTTSLTNIQNTFMSCYKLAEVDLSSFDFRNKSVTTGQMFTYAKADSTVYYDPVLFKLDPYSIHGVPASQSWVVRPSKNNGYWLDMTGITGATTITLLNTNNLPTEEILTDWGDGTQNSELTHTYSTAGNYLVVSNLQKDNGMNSKLTPYLTKATIYYYEHPSNLFYGCQKMTEVTLTDNWVRTVNEKGSSNMWRFLYDCTKLTKINYPQNEKIKPSSLSYAFHNCKEMTNIDLGWINYSILTSMDFTFSTCLKLTEIVGVEDVDTSKVTNMNGTFKNCSSLTSIDLSSWDVSQCINMASMFASCTLLTDVSFINEWDLSKVKSFNALCHGAKTLTSFTLDSKDLSSLTDCNCMLAGSPNLQTVQLTNLTTPKTINVSSMFENDSGLTSVDFSGTIIKPNNASLTFKNCSSLTSLDLSSWDVSQCTNMTNMFNSCSKIVSINTKGWKTDSLTTTVNLFFGCYKLSDCDVAHFNMSKVTTMESMFRMCYALKTIDVSNWDISSMTSMQYGFAESGVVNLDCSNLKLTDNINTNYAFLGCDDMENLDISNYTKTNLTTFPFRNKNLKAIGMLYSSAEAINNLLSKLYENIVGTTIHPDGITIYYYDADPSQLTPVEGVTFKKYQVTSTIQLPPHIQLHSLPDGTRDEVDLETGVLTRNIGYTEHAPKDLFGITTGFGRGTFYNATIDRWIGSQHNVSHSLFRSIVHSNFSTKSSDTESNIVIYTSGSDWINISIKTSELISKGYEATSDGLVQYVLNEKIIAMYPISAPTTEQLILNYNNSCDYGRILPTGMCDKYDVVNSIYTQTMTSILLDGENTWDGMEEMTNVVKFTATGSTVGVDNLNMLGEGGLYCDNDLFPNINDDSDTEHCRVGTEGNKFYIYVNKNRLMSPDLIGWQIWLQSNSFNLIYELSEHLTYTKPYEELDPTQARWQGMDCIRDGGIKYHTNSHDNITMYPTLEYVAPSINNFELTMLEPNTDYTIYAEGINTNDTINFGGTDIRFSDGKVFTSGDNQWLRIDNNDSFYNMVITKGDTTGEVVPYFEGMTSVENPKANTQKAINGLLSTAQGKWEGNDNFGGSVLYVPMIDVKVGQKYIIASSSKILVAVWRSKTWVNNDVTQIAYADVLPDRPLIFTPDVSQVAIYMVVAKYLTDKAHEVELRMYEGEVDYGYVGRAENPKVIIDSTVSYTDLKLRSLPNGVKDTINVVTGEYVQRVGEIVFDGDENWEINWAPEGKYLRCYRVGGYFDSNTTITDVNTLLCDRFIISSGHDWSSKRKIMINSGYINVMYDKMDINAFKQWVKENPITLYYPLDNPITKKLDPQTLLAYAEGTINLSSDTGLLPTTHYTVPSTNTFNLPSMKTGTRYTLKYPSASGSITIGDITYSISSDSMLFTTPLKINGDKSAIIFSDNDPENVILIEGAYNTREVPYFTGVKSVKNPNITVIDQLSTESNTYSCATDMELRGLPNGVADSLDIVNRKLTRVVGVRDYEPGDENLANVWTDGYETVYALSSPIVTNVEIETPEVTTHSLINLSSEELIPQLNYRAPSSNNFPLDLLTPNTTYTLYADTLVDGTYTLGGTHTGTFTGTRTIALGDVTEKLLTFNGDLGLSNVMLVKGNSLKSTLPYFRGIKSVTNAHFLVEGYAGEENEITMDNDIVLRDCNGIKDVIDLSTCILTKRTGEIVLAGKESWYKEESESINGYNVFKLTLTGITQKALICDRFNYVLNGVNQDCIYSYNNQLCLRVAETTINGNTLDALKSWLVQNPTTVVYPLNTPIEVKLENTWTTIPPTSYSNKTSISTTVTNSLKPMISITIATTTLEQIVSELETRNTQLEEENVATMLALTDIYEVFGASTTVVEQPQVQTYSMRRSAPVEEPVGMAVSPMGMIYAKLVNKGFKTIEEVPYNLQSEVMYALRGME